MMNIVLCTDSKYIPYCTITICSVCENNQGIPIHFYVVGSKLTDDNKEILLALVSKYKNKVLTFIEIDNEIVKAFPIGKAGQNNYISLASYYRLFLPALLPVDIEKIIYLDCDVIVRKSLETMWQNDITKYAIAGVLDTLAYDVRTYNRLRYSPDFLYINAGVLLINLTYWRQHNCLEKCLTYAKTYPERLQCHDQDILNAVFKEEKFVIPFTYNFHDGLFRKDLRMLYTHWDEISNTENNPAVIHYSAHIKAWHTDCVHPFVKDFKHYQALTLFKNLPTVKRRIGLKIVLKRNLKTFLSKFHFCSAPKAEIEYREILF